MNRNAAFTPRNDDEPRILTEEEELLARRRRAAELGIQIVGRL